MTASWPNGQRGRTCVPPPTTGPPVARPYLAGWTPTSMRTLRAILRCKFHSSMALAIIRPLRKRKLVSRKYWGQTLLEGRMPMKGKRMMGRRAVTDRGRASVHQYTAISRMINRQRPSCAGDGTNTWSMNRGHTVSDLWPGQRCCGRSGDTKAPTQRTDHFAQL